MNFRRKGTVVRAKKNSRRPNSSRGKSARNRSPHSSSLIHISHPRNDLEEAIQRYVDLFDFAAIKLLGRSRQLMIGSPLTLCVFPQDRPLFLDHLLRCRNATGLVETELRMSNAQQEVLFVHLVSQAIASLHDGTASYQTAIV